MAQQGEKKGFIARMLEGKERDEEYARSTLPSNRWALFWDIFKGRFSKLVIVNLLMLLFFIPLVAVGFFMYLWTGTMGGMYPFSNSILVGFPAYPNLMGAPEQINLSATFTGGALMIVAALIAAVGISGGMYVIRNMVWTEGIFVANDFWRGIKINIVVVLQSTLFYSIFLFGFFISIRFSEYIIASGTGSTVWMTISMAISYVAIVIFTMMYLWMLAMGGSYKLKFFQLLKNSFLMTFGLIFQNIFFVILMAIPVILILLGSFFQMVGIVFMILFGLSFMLLVWLDYTQWAFDKFIESKREGGKVNRGIYAKVGKGGSQSKAVQEYEANLQAAMSVKSDLSSRPIKPITDDLKVYELPESFSRDDLKKLRESKERIIEDTEKYAEEHQNDEKYVTYNARFEKPAEEEDKKDKKGKKDKKSKKGDEGGDAE
ncbi:MAG TPA: hypothetical protein H9741_06055 [Candidatus Borkfalkia faecipullorum]|uniref:Uncharacterized protein n=1 Tax=Candidatus Borkfalkia faecipullorum TaxID=2838510 RepID=A0A9D1V8V1_9FIRM|nr:hypothetical protein [Candidatus Borkfalkia faecipullorum]